MHYLQSGRHLLGTVLDCGLQQSDFQDSIVRVKGGMCAGREEACACGNKSSGLHGRSRPGTSPIVDTMGSIICKQRHVD